MQLRQRLALLVLRPLAVRWVRFWLHLPDSSFDSNLRASRKTSIKAISRYFAYETKSKLRTTDNQALTAQEAPDVGDGCENLRMLRVKALSQRYHQ